MIRQAVDPERPDPALIDRAAEVIRTGGLVAFPTETVYGLGANALDEAAVRRIFEAKGRPATNPLIVHVPDAGSARRLVRHWPEAAERLAAAFWPGPLTLVLPRAHIVPAVVTAGLPDVAVRAPGHPVALALLRAAGVPIVAPSANPSTGLSPTTAAHVDRGLRDRVDLILDAGATNLGIESTVIALDEAHPQPLLLRPGALAPERIEAVVGRIRTPRPGATGPRASPGLMDRHYAPKAELRVFPSGDRERAEHDARTAAAEGRVVAVIVLDRGPELEGDVARTVRMPADPDGYARRLYAELHRLDEGGCELILVEDLPEGRAWDALRDRLRRAAT